ncbi:MAG: YdeI/OmpD-associated family protein [Bacteroidetes bacterium]|nr:YdeI/OmpD-associated family protein [Bacteroidota bacterium]
MNKFKATIQIIGINPYVFVPDEILTNIFSQAKKDKGAIPIRGTINEKPYKQTLLKFKGEWRLYVNTTMLKNSPKKIGETIEIFIEFDPVIRVIQPHPEFLKALNNNKDAKNRFDNLSPSLQKEIIRYISFLKTDKSITANTKKAMGFLLGKNRFIGREPINTN